MNTGLYSACAGLVARTQALDLAANNLANLNTSGYKAQSPTFRSMLASADGVTNTMAASVNSFGVLGQTRADLAQGPIDRTGNDLDFALQGSGFFAVQTGAGRLYTRNGSFHVNQRGLLVTAAGNPVLGTSGAITVPPGKLSISASGTISVDGALVGQLKVVDFAPGTQLTPEGNACFSAAASAERAAPETKIVQGALEGSNVNSISAAVGLVSLQRHADMLQRALTAFHADFNRIAAQDLSRI